MNKINSFNVVFKNIFLMLTLLLVLVSLSGCFDRDPELTEQDEKTVLRDSDHMKYIAQALSEMPLNVQTVPSAYLVARHAQIANDWKTSSSYIDKVIEEEASGNGFDRNSMTPEDRQTFEKQAMILNLGAGNLKQAHKYAKMNLEKSVGNGQKEIVKEGTDALSVLVLTLPHIRAYHFNKAENLIDQMPSGGISDLINPIVKNWVIFSKIRDEIQKTGESSPTGKAHKKLPKIHKNILGQELYHLILAADYAGDTEYLKMIFNAEFPQKGLTAKTLTNIADILVRHGLLEQALSLYQDIKILNPSDNTLNQKIALLEKGEKIPQAMLAKALETPHIGVAKAILDVGLLLFQESSLDSARIFAYLALDLDPTLENAHLLLAYIAEKYGEYDEAIAYFKTVTSDDSDRYIQAQQQIAELQGHAGDVIGALETLDALSEYKDSIDLQVQIGDISRQHEHYQQALKSYNKAFEMINGNILPHHWSLYYSRGIVLERLSKWDQAEKDFKKALEFEPNEPFVLNYLGYSWVEQGKNLEDALNMITKAVNLRPHDAYIIDSLGWVYFKLNDFHNAIDPLEKAVALFPEDPTINDHLGDAYWKVGRKHEARFQWNRALSFTEESSETLSDEESQDLIVELKKKLQSGL